MYIVHCTRVGKGTKFKKHEFKVFCLVELKVKVKRTVSLFFSSNNPIWAPDSQVKAFSNVASNSRRYRIRQSLLDSGVDDTAVPGTALPLKQLYHRLSPLYHRLSPLSHRFSPLSLVQVIRNMFLLFFRIYFNVAD
jgi:hypothetical protein